MDGAARSAGQPTTRTVTASPAASAKLAGCATTYTVTLPRAASAWIASSRCLLPACFDEDDPGALAAGIAAGCLAGSGDDATVAMSLVTGAARRLPLLHIGNVTRSPLRTDPHRTSRDAP